MQKLIPLMYFYLVSLVGLALLLIGIFADVHVLVNIFSYPQYPLSYDASQRCVMPQPIPLMKTNIAPVTQAVAQGAKSNQSAPDVIPVPIAPPVYNYNYYSDCLKQVALERKQAEVQDIEKAVSFTLIGLIVFGIHFYFARKKSV